MPALESLAIIAYRQPVTAPEIQELRGVNSSGVLKKLLERRLIRIAGRKEVVGKPFLYATTREFLQHFGLRSLKELPPLEQFEELFGGDGEAAPEDAGPDPEEEVEREVADLQDKEDDAMGQVEAEAIEAERAAAEEAEEAEEMLEAVVAASDGEPEPESKSSEAADEEEPAPSAEPSPTSEEKPAEAEQAAEAPRPEAVEPAPQPVEVEA